VVSCINGRQAIDLATSRRFDMIFMDMQMPVVDGFEATALMRQQGLTTPIIALTAYAFSADRKRCLDAGCTDYIAKPVRPEVMEQIVRKHTPLSVPTT
jgi:CheY-like chemotaxis protein